jgi:hypothetical protein
MVSGKYVSKLSDASHVLFEGHLDGPSFRGIAIQRITKLTGNTVTLDKSGDLKIEQRNGRDSVETTYTCFIFGKQRTRGSPFKDENTPAITNNPPA